MTLRKLASQVIVVSNAVCCSICAGVKPWATAWSSLARNSARVRAMAGKLDDESLGRSLFELAAAARERGLDPEGALRRHAEGITVELGRRAKKSAT